MFTSMATYKFTTAGPGFRHDFYNPSPARPGHGGWPGRAGIGRDALGPRVHG